MTPFQEIERDLEWRESEMAVLRILLAADNISDREKLVLFRAAWALLYAHYEGFCKFALTVYFDALQNTGKLCKNLPAKTQAFALNNSLKSIRSLPTPDLISRILNFEIEFMESAVNFPEVDTESNLWPNTLGSLLEDADITIESLSAHNRALATLVNRRNKIAHGERDMIPEYSYYIGFEDAVKTVMYNLALAIDEKMAL